MASIIITGSFTPVHIIVQIDVYGVMTDLYRIAGNFGEVFNLANWLI